MADYRVYFLGGKKDIRARDEFQAESDAAALLIAGWAFDACSEFYAGYELWAGTRKLIPEGDTLEPQAKCDGLSSAELSRSVQQIVADRERAMLDSAWSVARSRKLLHDAEVLRDTLDPNVTTPARKTE